ncbi:MAG: hypothetical protein Pars2KO_13840 [Parasphingorhabdus sp.]
MANQERAHSQPKRFRSVTLALICAGSLTFATTAMADDDKEEKLTKPPAIYTELVACKNISDSQQRLACYDEKVAALETAQTSKQVVIADREQVKEARRGLFGLSLPRIKLFGGDNDEGANINQIESTIVSVRQLRGGKLVLSLEDGATWQQTEVRTMRKPRKGDPIVIKRASLGSFTAKVKGGRSFKIKRIVR